MEGDLIPFDVSVCLPSEVAQGEMGYFNQRFVGTVQYLLFWVDGWYPAQLSPGEWWVGPFARHGIGRYNALVWWWLLIDTIPMSCLRRSGS